MKFRPAKDKPPPQVPSRLSTGFPSPADDYEEPPLDLHDYAVSNPLATYFFTAESRTMASAGIAPGDTLVVDRSIQPKAGSLVIAEMDDEFTIKRVRNITGILELEDDSGSYLEEDSKVWGTVTYVLKKV